MENNNNSTDLGNTNVSSPSMPPASQVVPQPQVAPVMPQQPPAIHEPQPDPQTGYETLEAHYRLAIDLRLEHLTYDEISSHLIRNHYPGTVGTVQQWFSKNGPCHDTYEKMVEIIREEDRKRREKRQQMVDENVDKALIVANRVLRKALKNDELTEQDFKVAQDALDRGGVPKQSKVDSKIESEGINQLGSLITSILENKPLPNPEPQQ